MSTTSSDTARRDVDARDAAAHSSRNGAEAVDVGGTVDPRIQLLGQLRASMFDEAEHPDTFTRAWNGAMESARQSAIRALFPLPVPVYSCRFPVDDVSRGLREIAGAHSSGCNRLPTLGRDRWDCAPYCSLAGVVQIDFSDVEDA